MTDPAQKHISAMDRFIVQIEEGIPSYDDQRWGNPESLRRDLSVLKDCIKRYLQQAKESGDGI
jgi:hypothetical protein